MIFHESPTEALETMMRMSRTVGKIQWQQLGEPAHKDAMGWLGHVDRATEATRAKDMTAAVAHMQLAHMIELDWPKFNMVSERVIKVLSPLRDPTALQNYMDGVGQ